MRKQTHILIVDDDVTWRERMKDELFGLGCELLVASGFSEAEALIDAHEGVLALVACDNSMPLGDRPFPNAGIAIRKRMHLVSAAQATIPFILFTSEIDDEQREQAGACACTVVLKRFNIDGELAAAARQLLAAT